MNMHRTVAPPIYKQDPFHIFCSLLLGYAQIIADVRWCEFKSVLRCHNPASAVCCECQTKPRSFRDSTPTLGQFPTLTENVAVPFGLQA